MAISFQNLTDLSNELQKNDYFVIVDEKLKGPYTEFLNQFEKKIYITAGEGCKTIKSYEAISCDLIRRGVHRGSHLLVIGGASLSDLVGFIASTLYRGIKFSIVPTTLLAMVDGAIGGKTAINIGGIKNMLGSFYLPQEVFLCPIFFKTLNKEDMVSGFGEIVKYAFLDKKIADAILNQTELQVIIDLCVDYKEKVTTIDFKENSTRMKLNLGHTFGHAYEARDKIPHGLAVLYGLKSILELFSPSRIREFELILEKLDISLEMDKSLSASDIKKYVLKDKKRANNNSITLVIPENEIVFKQITNDELLSLF